MKKRIFKLGFTVALTAIIAAALFVAVSAATYTGSCGTNVTYKLDTLTGVLEINGTGAMTNYSSLTDAPWCSYRSYVKTVKIGDSVTSIGSSAFWNCYNLTNVEIPDSVTSVGSSAFEDCFRLKNLYISDLESWLNVSLETSSSHPLYLAGGNLYIDGVLATDIEIPDTVTSIGNYAFNDCESLTSVVIPDSVTSIGSSAFGGCSSLTSVVIGDSVTSIGSSAFWDCYNLTNVEIPDSVTSIGSSAFYYCSSLTSVEIPDSVTSIGYEAFCYCSSLTSVEIGDSVTSIGYQTFYGCSSLASVEIGDSVTSIGQYAFAHCSSLTSVVIPNSVTSIGYGAFEDCSSLTSVEIGDSVTSIGQYAFYSCSSLTTINVDETNTTYCDIYGVLFSKDKKTLITYPGGGATTYTIPDSVTSIGNYAFWDCSSLTSVEIPDSVTSIGEDAFSGCNSLKTIFCYKNSAADAYFSSSSYTKKYLNIFTITYDLDGGSGVFESQAVKWSESITLHTHEPTKTGYDFMGWKANGSSTKQISVSGLESAHNYANNTSKTWTISSAGAKSITLTFDSRTAFESNYDFLYIYDQNGTLFGKYSGTSLAGKTLTVQGEAVKLKLTSDSSQVNWGFAVTSATADFDIIVYAPGAEFTANDDTTLVAVWEEHTYSVSYDANGGSGAPSAQTKYYSSDLTLSSVLPAKEGYNFMGWAGSDGKTYNAGDVYSENVVLVLTAIWEIKTYTITYDANGGENVPESFVKDHFASYTISSVVPEKEGYNFMGWAGSDDKTYNAGDVYSENAVLVLTAIWEIKTYTITYDVNGGENAPENAIKEHFASYTISSVIPTRIGYDFKGWTTNGLSTKQLSVSGIESAHNYANNTSKTWTISSDGAKSITLTFDSRTAFESKYDFLYIYDENGTLFEKYSGTDLAGETVTVQGESVKLKLTSDNSNVYWGFAVTSATANFEVTVYAPGDEYSANADVTLTAFWELSFVVMTYDPNGGSVSEPTKSVQYTTAIGKMLVPVRDGYTFDGWYTEKDGGELVTSDNVVNTLDDFTVYAHWTVNDYTVFFNANGGIVPISDKIVTFDSAYGTLPVPAYSGCKFDGWYTERNGGELITAETIVKIGNDHTLYAHWTANDYLVLFDANGGKCDQTFVTVAFNSVYGDLPVPTRVGYTFAYWSRNLYGGSTVTKDTKHTIAGDVTLYAVWIANTYKLTFDALGGDLEITEKTVTFGSSYSMLPTPTMANYVFGGWFLEKEYTNKVTSETIVSTADDHTVYAMWIPLSYTIVYDANGGEGAPEQQTKEYSVDHTLSDVEPIRKGFRFKGWSTKADGAVAYAPGATYSENAALTLYAVWEAISYGDPNGDGAINAMDAVLIAQKLAGWAVDIDDSAADVNGDGDINAMDAVLLAQFLAGWDVTLG